MQEVQSGAEWNFLIQAVQEVLRFFFLGGALIFFGRCSIFFGGCFDFFFLKFSDFFEIINFDKKFY